MARYTANIHRDRYEVKTFTDVDRDRVREVLNRVKAAGRKFVLEPEAHEIFKAYGFPVAPFVWAQSEDQAVQAAADLGYPVALKSVSPDIIHKFDVGGVKLNLAGADDIRRAYGEILASVARTHPGAVIQGMLVQKMVLKGRETILGMTRDPHFGPLLMFGLGGTFVEVFRDVSFSLAPISEDWALKMIQGLKGFRILKSFRGDPPADLAAIVASLERLSQMVLDFAELKELDINPFMVFDEGQGAAVVDARIFLS
jgi:acyl-CoA synthetase (NDP forming)